MQTADQEKRMQTIVNTFMYPPPPPGSRTHAVHSLGVGDNEIAITLPLNTCTKGRELHRIGIKQKIF